MDFKTKSEIRRRFFSALRKNHGFTSLSATIAEKVLYETLNGFDSDIEPEWYCVVDKDPAFISPPIPVYWSSNKCDVVTVGYSGQRGDGWTHWMPRFVPAPFKAKEPVRDDFDAAVEVFMKDAAVKDFMKTDVFKKFLNAFIGAGRGKK